MGAVHGRQVGAVLIAKLDRCTRSVADLASLIDTFSRRGVALISAAESLDTSSAGGRLVVNVLGAVAVGAGSHRRAHVSSAAGAQAAGPRHRRGGALRVPVHRRAPGMAPGRAGLAQRVA